MRRFRLTVRSLHQLLLAMILGLVSAACASVTVTPADTPMPAERPSATSAANSVVSSPGFAASATPLSPSQTPVPFISPTPTPSAELTSQWQVHALEIEARFVCGEMPRAIWSSNDTITGEDDRCQTIFVDIANGNKVVPAPAQSTPDPSDEIASPHQTYRTLCDESGIRIYRVTDNELIRQTDIQALDGCFSVKWSQDETKISIVSDDNRVYVLRLDRATPTEISRALAVAANWSPDGRRLAWGSCDSINEQAYANILGEDGQQLAHFKIGGCGASWSGYLSWLNSDTIADPLRFGWDLTVYEYFNATTGKPLGFFFDSIERVVQAPMLSPNGRWHVVEEPRQSRAHPFYMLYDLEAQEGFALSNTETNYIKFVDWSPDSETLYLISRPVSATAASSLQMPFGFLSLNPHNREYRQLFAQAVDATLDTSQQWAWVAFPAKHDDGKLGLDGGLFNLASATLLGREFVSEQITYRNPAEGDLVPAAWSNDAQRLVFGDSRGRIVLIDTLGSKQQLGMGLPQAGWPSQVHFTWSPDSQHFIAQFDDRVWVVSAPNR